MKWFLVLVVFICLLAAGCDTSTTATPQPTPTPAQPDATKSGPNTEAATTETESTSSASTESPIQDPTAGDIGSYPNNEDGRFQDILTPAYYDSSDGDPFRDGVNKFIHYSRMEQFHHPLEDELGQLPLTSTPNMGSFGAAKGPNQDFQYHPAIDLHVGIRETNVNLYAAHEGSVAMFRDAPKYRQYISITKNIEDQAGDLLGKLVTIYGHVDLDLDEAEALFMDGQYVDQGELISKHLYANTIGGPHLHFEIRYYRLDDVGNETFYGGRSGPNGTPAFTEPSSGPWSLGYWHPDIGYGYADPRNHGLP